MSTVHPTSLFQTHTPTIQTPRRYGPKVVVIDDQSSCRATFKRILMGLDTDVEIETFDKPLAALAWCEKNHPALIITDFRMPEIDGIELVYRLRKIPMTAQVPIILATIASDKSLKAKALNAGATDFLTKPIDHDECRARCRNLLALSEYQTTLRNHIAALTLQLNSNKKNESDELGNAEPASHISVEYSELFMLTSTVAAIDKLLKPLISTITTLEEAAQLPLVGRRAKTD